MHYLLLLFSLALTIASVPHAINAHKDTLPEEVAIPEEQEAALDDEVVDQFTRFIAHLNGLYPSSSPFLKASARAQSVFERLCDSGSMKMKRELTELAFRIKVKLEERHWTRKKKMAAFHSFMREIFGKIEANAHTIHEKRMVRALKQNLTIAINPILTGLGAKLGQFPWIKAATAALLLSGGAYAGYRLYERHKETSFQKKKYEDGLEKNDDGSIRIENHGGTLMVLPKKKADGSDNNGPNTEWIPLKQGCVREALTIAKDAIATTNKALQEAPPLVATIKQMTENPNNAIHKLAEAASQITTGGTRVNEFVTGTINQEIKQAASKRAAWKFERGLTVSAHDETLRDNVQFFTDEAGAEHYRRPRQEGEEAATTLENEIDCSQEGWREFVLPLAPTEQLFRAIPQLTQNNGALLTQTLQQGGTVVKDVIDHAIPRIEVVGQSLLSSIPFVGRDGVTDFASTIKSFIVKGREVHDKINRLSALITETTAFPKTKSSSFFGREKTAEALRAEFMKAKKTIATAFNSLNALEGKSERASWEKAKKLQEIIVKAYTNLDVRITHLLDTEREDSPAAAAGQRTRTSDGDASSQNSSLSD